MPTKRLTMRRIHRLMTMHFGAGAGTRVIARELGISHSTVREYLARIVAAGITWPLPVAVTDEELERQLFANGGVRAGARHYAEPDWAVVARELKRPGVNLMILWEEYRAIHTDGYAYSRYCQLFREFERRLLPSMRQTHVAGDKAFVDFSGKKIPIIDPISGAVRGRRFSSPSWARPISPTRKQPGHRACRTGSAHTCECFASGMRGLASWYPTI